MLKSHFNISHTDDVVEEEEEVEVPTPTPEVRVVEVPIKETLDLPKLLRAQVSQRLGMVGKTAEGDG